MNNNVQNQLDYFIKIRKIPNIVFHGTSGCGKRTIVYKFINQIYNHDKSRIKSNVMFVNCAHGKGIRFIRDELKYFAKVNMQCNENNMFKSIVLMNADELTIDAQSALRRCIELFSHNTRFFIIVENKYKLLNPILSRFCEIYIPDIMSLDTCYTNYQTQQLEQTYHLDTYNKERRDNICNAQISGVDLQTMDHKWFMNMSNTLYEEAISCEDLIAYLSESGAIDETQTMCLKFCYDKIKSEYRNEKMALFYLFDYIYLRSNKSLENISFI